MQTRGINQNADSETLSNLQQCSVTDPDDDTIVTSDEEKHEDADSSSENDTEGERMTVSSRKKDNTVPGQSVTMKASSGEGEESVKPKPRRGKKGKGVEGDEHPDTESKEEMPRGKTGGHKARGGKGRGTVTIPKKPQRGQRKEKDDGAGAEGANLDELEEGGGRKWAEDQPAGCIVMVVGQAGSGKSYFARALAEGKSGWVVVEGSPKDCEVTLMRAMFGKGIYRGPQKVVFDRRNMEAEERRSWLKLAMVTKNQAMAVYFDVPVEECRQRLVERGEAITANQGWTKVVAAPPTTKEGFKEVFRVRTPEDVEKVRRYFDGSKEEDEGRLVDEITSKVASIHA